METSVADGPFRPRGTLLKILYQPAELIHLFFSLILFIGLVIYLSLYFTKRHSTDAAPPTGVAILIILCIFSLTSIIFDILILIGIPMVWSCSLGSYLVVHQSFVRVTVVLAILNLIWDLQGGISGATFAKHFLLNSIALIAMLYLFYPAFQIGTACRDKKYQTEQYEKFLLLLSTSNEGNLLRSKKFQNEVEVVGNRENASVVAIKGDSGDFRGGDKAEAV